MDSQCRAVLPSDLIVKRLVYVKLLYSIAKERFGKGLEIDTAQAILSLDNCFENIIWIVLSEKDPTKYDELKRKEYPPFQVLLNYIKTLKKDFDTATVKELHEARNLVQHSGIMVSRSHAEGYFVKAEIGLKWQDISLAMLIRDDEVASFYKKAEEYFASKQYLQSAKMMIRAFEKAKENRQFNQFGSYILVQRLAAEDGISKNENDPKRRLLNYMNKLYAELEVLKLGLDYKGWREYRLMLGTLDPDDDLSELTVPVPTVTRKEYDIMLFTSKENEIEQWLVKTMPFVLQSILQWQEKSGIFDFENWPSSS